MTTKLITITLLTIFLVSCKNQKLICNEIKSVRVPPVVLKDVSFQFMRCRARCFDVNKWEALPIANCPEISHFDLNYDTNDLLNGSNEVVNLPLQECEGLAGFSIYDIGLFIKPTVKRLSEINEATCGGE